MPEREGTWRRRGRRGTWKRRKGALLWFRSRRGTRPKTGQPSPKAAPGEGRHLFKGGASLALAKAAGIYAVAAAGRAVAVVQASPVDADRTADTEPDLVRRIGYLARAADWPEAYHAKLDTASQSASGKTFTVVLAATFSKASSSATSRVN